MSRVFSLRIVIVALALVFAFIGDAIPALPVGIVRLINKAIQREPDKRFPSAATMAEALRRQASREAKEGAS